MAEPGAKVSALSGEYRNTGERLAARLGRPVVSGLYLPAPVADETFRDEFGFVLLEDGSVGAFYVSMGDMLQRLWRRYPRPRTLTAEAATLLRGFTEQDPVLRAMAVGCYNALTASLFRAVGFEPPDRAPHAAARAASPGAPIGMVGYFRPLVDRLTAQGHQVLVLELAPERIPERPGVAATVDAHDLRACGSVLCTASALINDSLQDLLTAVGRDAVFELIGPSGSGLPDPLFARGVSAVGGILFADSDTLLATLRRGEPWGAAGRKYQLDAAGYPGLDALTARLADRGADPGQT
jgi:uncharacterized protein (DUF4213/DUF364 family)